MPHSLNRFRLVANGSKLNVHSFILTVLGNSALYCFLRSVEPRDVRDPFLTVAICSINKGLVHQLSHIVPYVCSDGLQPSRDLWLILNLLRAQKQALILRAWWWKHAESGLFEEMKAIFLGVSTRLESCFHGCKLDSPPSLSPSPFSSLSPRAKAEFIPLFTFYLHFGDIPHGSTTNLCS
jgi:hypothetical protein